MVLPSFIVGENFSDEDIVRAEMEGTQKYPHRTVEAVLQG